MKISIIVPAYNEVKNIPHLISEFDDFIKGNKNYEVIIVDDGSVDGTGKEISKYLEYRPWLKTTSHKKNLGKTEAIQSGYKVSDGDIIVIFDADLQYDTNDIPKLIQMIEKDYDVACGRRIGYYEKKAVSKIYYWLAKKLFNIKIHDLNAMKAMRKEVIDSIIMRQDWHRFIIPLAYDIGFKVGEVAVKLRPRRFGEPKYSSHRRILVGFFDLIAVKSQQSFLRKPMLFFGTLGFFSIGSGIIIGLIAVILRIFGIGLRPLLYLVILLVLAGLLLFALGLLGETSAMIIDRLQKLERNFNQKTFDHRQNSDRM